MECYGCYAEAMLKKNKHRDNAPCSTAIGHRHIGTLNSGGKMKTCEKNQIFADKKN